MHDAPKIIFGLLVFLLIMTFPIWYGAVDGKEAQSVPDPIIKTADIPGKDTCIKDTEYMKHNHMVVLDNWRDSVVRDNKRVYIAEDGRKFNKSLSRTCLDCHSNKEEFCDRCHNYAKVEPYCWECHLQTDQMTPKGGE